tara:strand:- start:934 stop:1206 length:273 start_codon:yes stop_codon:yes gene_type:complete
MGQLFKAVSELAMFALILGLFFLIFGQALGSIGDVAIATSPATLGGKDTETLIGNVIKSVLLWVPLVGMGMALYLAASTVLEKERASGRR